MEVLPSALDEVISVTPAICPNWRSSGVATDEAMISALAPGKLALIEMVGKSTCGSGETGKILNAIKPANVIATTSRVVAIGRLMKGAETFMDLILVQADGLAYALVFVLPRYRLCCLFLQSV